MNTAAITNDTTCPRRKSQRPIWNQRRQYSCACAGRRSVCTVRSLSRGQKGSNERAIPISSMRSRILLIPAFFALPHSDAWSETSMPVGRRPRKAAMTSQEPSGISTRKKVPISESGAGW